MADGVDDLVRHRRCHLGLLGEYFARRSSGLLQLVQGRLGLGGGLINRLMRTLREAIDEVRTAADRIGTRGLWKVCVSSHGDSLTVSD